MTVTADTGLSLVSRKTRILNALKLQPMTCSQLSERICIDWKLVQGAVLSLIADGDIKRVGITKTQQTIYSAEAPVFHEHPLLSIANAMAREGRKNEISA